MKVYYKLIQSTIAMRFVILSLAYVFFVASLGAQPETIYAKIIVEPDKTENLGQSDKLAEKIENDSLYQGINIATEKQKDTGSTNNEDNKNHDVSIIKDYTDNIEKNTHRKWHSDGWTLFGIFSVLVAFCSAFYTYLTYGEQKTTKTNTQKLSQDLQRDLLNDILRHLYRNYVITYAMRTKMNDIDYKGYPSEEHYEKLKIPMENIHLESFYGDSDKFQILHVLYLNLRNYNEEVSVALKHIKNPYIKREIVEDDFDILEFKVSFLTEKIFKAILNIWGDTEDNKEDMRKALNFSLSGETNATDNINVYNSNLFKHISYEEFSKTKYSLLFEGDELIRVCDIFNNDVCEERKKNRRGAWKVRVIKFVENKERMDNTAHSGKN